MDFQTRSKLCKSSTHGSSKRGYSSHSFDILWREGKSTITTITKGYKRSLILNQVFPSREFDLCVFVWDEETPLVVKDLETRSHHHSNVFSRDPGILPPREFVLRNGHQRSILDTGSQQPPVNNEISQAFQLEMSMLYLYSKLKAFSLA